MLSVLLYSAFRTDLRSGMKINKSLAMFIDRLQAYLLEQIDSGRETLCHFCLAGSHNLHKQSRKAYRCDLSRK